MKTIIVLHACIGRCSCFDIVCIYMYIHSIVTRIPFFLFCFIERFNVKFAYSVKFKVYSRTCITIKNLDKFNFPLEEDLKRFS